MCKISIIVPNYNHASFLPERLNSIFNQTFQDFEVILLDDASTDESLEILQEYAAKFKDKVTHLIINEVNSGSPFKQWKKGIALASGEYIWIAESDDYCDLRFLEECIAKFKLYPEISAVISNSRILGSNTSLDLAYPFDSKRDLVKLEPVHFIEKCPIGNVSALVLKKSTIINDEYSEYRYIGDKCFYFENFAHKFLFYNKKCLNYYRIHNRNVSQERDLKRELSKYYEQASFLKKVCIKDNALRLEAILAARKFRRKLTNRIKTRNLIFNLDALGVWIYLKFGIR